MGAVDERPHPPGDYDVVVVGSGPGGLQTGHFLDRLGVRHALISADDEPAGMFRKWPIFERLISWSAVDAPVDSGTREYERYDQNSLISDEPDLRALVPASMGRESLYPTRAEMQAGVVAFAERAVRVRYGCRWESTAVDEEAGGFRLATSDGAYSCRAAVFAVGATEPWKAPIPGVEDVPHYAEAGDRGSYAGRRVFIVGKRNSAFEVADALLPYARQIVLASPQPVRTGVLAHATVRPRYFQPLEVHGMGGGTYVLDAAIERIERTAGGFRARLIGTTYPGPLELETDAAIVATGFQAPLRDLPALGVATVAQGRIPALTAYWEASVPGIFFAGNAGQGAPELRKHGFTSASTSVRGFRYNARLLAQRIAEGLGATFERARLSADQVVPLLAAELASGPELWTQKGYLARAVTFDREDGIRDEGIVPLAAFVDAAGADAVAVAVETAASGEIYPAVYVRRGGRIREEMLDPHPLNAFGGEGYRRTLAGLTGDLSA